MYFEVESGHLVLFVEFDYKPQESDIFDKGHGNYLPGNPASVEITHIWLGHSNGRIDILKNISGAEKASIEEECLERAQEEE